jgi:hypothetical protein
MRKLARLLTATALLTGATLALPTAHAWTPWGGNMFGIDFGQSTGYVGYPGSGNGPWGLSMFGMDLGQSIDYGQYYGGPGPYAYPPYSAQPFVLSSAPPRADQAERPVAAY